MGANGSTLASGPTQGQHSREGRLKGRSQSTYALHCTKGSNNNGTPRSIRRNGSGKEDSEYYDIKNHHHHSSTGDGLSSSIPADLWDLPPNSQSYSPSRYRRRTNSKTQVNTDAERGQPGRKHRFLQMPVLETLINLSKKGGRSRGRGGAADPPDKISSRAKLYAASCPDVTQHTAETYDNSTTPPAVKRNYDEHDNVRASQPVLYGSSGGGSDMTARGPDIDGRQSTLSCVTGGQPKRRQSWTELRLEQHRRQSCASREDAAALYRHRSAMSLDYPYPAFPFISEDAIFQVSLQRDHRGLGLGFSVSGGADTEEPFAGLIRVKKVFPLGPAYQSGRLQPWDIILKANGTSLIGLTNHEALEVLRTTPTDTLLTVCRPPPLPELVSCTGGVGVDMAGYGPPPHVTHITRHYPPPPCPIHQHSRELGGPAQLPRSIADSFSSISSLPSVKSKSLSSLNPKVNSNTTTSGEFEIVLEKVAGSLGFTIRQDDSGRLGHYVRELVKLPALGDGRIQPGDRIVAVNSQDLEGMSHAEAVTFLRQCPPRVKLRLYRDPCPTPISNLSPPETHRIIIKDKTYRQEAIDMIHEMKERKQMSSSPDVKGSLPGSMKSGQGTGPCATLVRGYKQSQVDANGSLTLPKQRRAGVVVGMTPSPEVISAALDRFAGRSTPKSNESPDMSRIKSKVIGSGVTGTLKSCCPSEARSSGSGESTPAGTIIHQNRKGTAGTNKFREETAGNSKFENDSGEEEISGLGVRKPSFRQYTMHLDRISSLEDESFLSDLNQNDSIVSAPGVFGTNPDGQKFRPGQPAYQSAVFPSNTSNRLKLGGGRKNLSLSREEVEQFGNERRGGGAQPNGGSRATTSGQGGLASRGMMTSDRHDSGDWSEPNSISTAQQSTGGGGGGGGEGGGKGGLSKWKGIQFPLEDDDDDEEEDNLNSLDGSLPHRSPVLGGSDEGQSTDSAAPPRPTSQTSSTFLQVEKLTGLSQRQSPDGREFHEGEMNMIEVSSSELFNGEEIITVQLSRKWCSRLGFSIKGSGGHTFITAIYEDSVAGRDGRLHVGDEVIMVNNESIRNMETPEVIDMMRKTRGVITITLLRKHPTDTESTKSSIESDVLT